ncbi:Glycerol-3-phosphate dehydrogenase (NAD(P)+) [uncultured delta proteobacterium]|uniref:Glycerol-3-phosphate dehydrogenase [NAD(P)+] n=1 Tax=uncultured delta proteobacterium TaxID=34034 RepID=A0A212KBT6_9DELT|nr:Glycerol-3-phosphate dehydrogenase (NAD(P)+) [uncultured delta proteobacterium]
MHIAILGGGSWGTALAHVFAGRGHAVTILVRGDAVAREIRENHTNEKYLPGCGIHPAVNALTDAASALRGADIVVLAVPCQSMRGFVRAMAGHIPPGAAVICASKGMERGSHALMSRVIAEETPHLAARYAILSGPSFAREVMQSLPTAVVLGCEDQALAERLRAELATPMFRVYSSRDVIGVECGGALKNVMALAAGIADGLGFGHNSRAALITRGLAEMSRLGVALGGDAVTFMGLSGMGDLVLTATGDLSRNRQVGLRMGRGEALDDIIASMHHVAEGVPTTEAAYDLARERSIDLPITEAMQAIFHGQTAPETAVRALMGRALRDE